MKDMVDCSNIRLYKDKVQDIHTLISLSLDYKKISWGNMYLLIGAIGEVKNVLSHKFSITSPDRNVNNFTAISIGKLGTVSEQGVKVHTLRVLVGDNQSQVKKRGNNSLSILSSVNVSLKIMVKSSNKSHVRDLQ